MLRSASVQMASRRAWTMVSEDLSFHEARGHRPEPRQLIPRAVAPVLKRRGRALRLRVAVR